MVKRIFYPYLLAFSLFHLFFILFYVFHLNPKVLRTLQVFDFSQMRNLGVQTMEQGYVYWFVITFFTCTDTFWVFQEKPRAQYLFVLILVNQ
jgi:hypothetical protein